MKTFLLELLFRFLIILALISFVFFWQKLSCSILALIYLIVFWAILHEVFTYLQAYKFTILNGLLKENSKIKKLLSGKFLINIKSLIISIPLTLILFLGLSTADNILFLLTVLSVFIFIILLLFFKKISYNEFSFGYLYTKKWIFFIFSFTMIILYGIFFSLNFKDPNITSNFLEYARTLTHNPQINCLLCKDIYVLALYFEDMKQWFYSSLLNSGETSFLNMSLFFIFLSISMFAYFFALAHIYSYILHINTKDIPKKFKPDLFMGTLLALAFIALTLYISGFIKTPNLLDNQNMQTSHTEEAFRFVFGNENINIPASKTSLALKYMEENKVSLLTSTNSSMEKMVDEIFNEITPKITEEMANWYFSVLTDYTFLVYWATTSSVEDKVLEKFDSIFKKHFPKDFNERLLFIREDLENNFSQALKDSLKQYEVNSSINNYKTNIQMQIIIQDSFSSLQSNSFKRLSYKAGVTSATLGILGVLSTKSSIKLASKIVAKFALKSTAATASGGAGLACGPFAVVCSPVLALGTWFGVDYGITKLDESFNRESFETDIMESLNVGRQRLKADLNSAIELYYDEIYQNLNNKLERI